MLGCSIDFVSPLSDGPYGACHGLVLGLMADTRRAGFSKPSHHPSSRNKIGVVRVLGFFLLLEGWEGGEVGGSGGRGFGG